MNPKPTGHVLGKDLILTRTFRAPIADVWTSVTESESTARWFGRWEGDAGAGKTVRLQLLQREGSAMDERDDREVRGAAPPRRHDEG